MDPVLNTAPGAFFPGPPGSQPGPGAEAAAVAASQSQYQYKPDPRYDQIPTSSFPGPAATVDADTPTHHASSYSMPPPPSLAQQPQFQPTPSFPPPPEPTMGGGGGSLSQQGQMSGAAAVSNPFASGAGIKSVKSAAEFSLREYMSLQRRQASGRTNTEEEARVLHDRLLAQSEVVLTDLKTLRHEVNALVKAAEGNRIRRWIVGGIVATFIPAVKRIFRRTSSPDDEEAATSANDTEYAFTRSKSLMGRINDTVRGKHRWGFATVAFFVLAVLYVFQNEVSLRVAKTVHKRLKRLSNKITTGEGPIEEKDMELLKGWRWRILLLGKK